MTVGRAHRYTRILSGLVVLTAFSAGELTQARTLSPQASSCGTWHVVARLNPATRDGSLNAVTAVSPSDIWAVGSGSPLIEHWIGHQWTIVTTPRPAGSTGAILNAVTASSSTNVWAVGAAGNNPLSLHWDGSHWSIVKTPMPSGSSRSSLSGVASLSSNDVWAVGTAADRNYNDRPLIERWTGTKWHIVAGPGLQGTLSAVAAISPHDVWAVGTTADENPLAEHWNGKSWKSIHVEPSPPTGPSNMELNAVAAVSANDVWAMGDIGGGASTVTEHWNGTTWSIIPDVHAPGLLDAAVAISSGDVWAAGIVPSGRNQRGFLEHWNGGAWVKVKSAHATGLRNLPNNEITGLAATSASDVWGVGSSYLDGDQTLTERWDGVRWRVLSSPNPRVTSGALAAVSVSGAADGWAVGSRLWNGTTQPLTAHWNSTQWTAVPSVIIRGTSSEFNAVASVSPKDAWAVGEVTAFSGRVRPLVAHWDGRRWTRISVPAPSGDTILYGVAAVAKSDVWAVGAGGGHPVIEHWNGSRWQLTYDPTGPAGGLHAVTAISAGDVWAVGSDYQVITEHWDGKTWQRVTAPKVGDYSSFDGLAATAAGDVWAVGSDGCTSSCNGGPLIERWDGAHWKLVYSPDNGDDHALYAAEALSATNVWAIGRELDSTGREHGLSVHWNGRAWKVVRTANAGPGDVELDGVSGLGASVWAAGYSVPNASVALIEQFTAC